MWVRRYDFYIESAEGKLGNHGTHTSTLVAAREGSTAREQGEILPVLVYIK